MITGLTLKNSIISGANNLSNRRAKVDELNVFPVPDGDTGTNMGMTIGAARTELLNLPDDCTVEKAAQVTASAMLRGARGNSGVISSLLFRGFSKALQGKKTADAKDLVQALEKGVEGAYKAVMKPTEGTMLTVARVASEEAAASGIADAVELWQLVCTAAQRALDNTPEQLPVLKKAGVVDAGGQGLVYIFEGMLSVFKDNHIIAADEAPEKSAKLSTSGAGKGVYTDDLMKVEDIKNGYCTQFLVNKNDGASSNKLRAFLESNGDSVVVIEDDEVINCHVHTADPGKIVSHALQYGYLTNFKIENMHEQFLSRQAQGEGLKKQAAAEAADTGNEFTYAAVDNDRAFGFVAVAAGEGLKAIFTDLGADAVVSGGQTMNPSTADIVAAVQSVPAKTVFVLPNNKNIIMAAEQAQGIADRTIVVLSTRTIPQGITAMLNFDPDASEYENATNMMQAADKVATGLVTFAARDSDFDGRKIKKGEILGVAGLVGAQRTELMEGIFGLRAHTAGKVWIKGQEVAIKQPRDAIQHSVALLTEDRRATGIMGVLSVADNISIASLDALRKGPIMLDDKKILELVATNKEKMAIKVPSPKTAIKSLSGGNQQKVLIARWLANNPDVLILDEPTRGIDVGAKYEIYCIIADLAKQGKSIIMISSEMSEIIGMSNRVMVMCDGRITGFIDGKDATQENIMALATQFETAPEAAAANQ
mgnify:CR=1 FL=1